MARSAGSGLVVAVNTGDVAVGISHRRNWEQRRRTPTGAAQVLLRAIENDPRAVLCALAWPSR